MGTRIIVEIKGLSVVYRDGSYWNVVFMCDAHHAVAFSVDQHPHPSHPNLGEIGTRRTIDFDIGRPQPIPPSEPSKHSMVLNLAANYAHGKDDLRRVPNRLSSCVHLRLPNATIEPGDMNCSSWTGYVQDADRPGSPPMLISPKAKSIVFTIDVAFGANFEMQIRNDDGPTEQLGIPPTGELKLVFDNDCKANCHDNDSIQVYRLLQSISGRRFFTGYAYGRDNEFPTPAQVEAWERDPNSNKELVTTRMGNCDPCIVEPPPPEI